MSCKGCGGQGPMFLGSRLPTSALGEIVAMGDELKDYPKVRVVLHGAVANYMVVGRATRLKYGYHKVGDVLWVHPNDQEADPETFVRADETPATAPGMPTFPGEVRTPEPPEARKAFKSLKETPAETFPAPEQPAQTEAAQVHGDNPSPDQPTTDVPADSAEPTEVINPDVQAPEGITEVQPEEKAEDAPVDSQPS